VVMEDEDEEVMEEDNGTGGMGRDANQRLEEEGVAARDSLGQTPLHLAVLNNSQEAVKLLGLEYKSKMNDVDNFGLGVIHHAVINNLEEMLRLLLTHQQAFQLDPNLIYDITPSATSSSALASSSPSLSSTPSSSSLGRGNALHLAVKYNYERIVKLLLEFGVNPHVRNHEGWTPSQLAERLGHDHLRLLFTKVQPSRGRESNDQKMMISPSETMNSSMKLTDGDKNEGSSGSGKGSRSVLSRLIRAGTSSLKRSRSPQSCASNSPSSSRYSLSASPSPPPSPSPSPSAASSATSKQMKR